MRYDGESLFSDNQAITADATSTDTLKVPVGLGNGTPVPIELLVTEALVGASTVEVKLQGSETSGGIYTDLQTLGTLASAAKKGTKLQDYIQPGVIGDNQYLRLNYNVSGSNLTGGKVIAGIVKFHENRQSNKAGVSIG